MKIELLKNKVFLDNEGLKKEIHPFWLRERVNSDIHVDKATQQRLFDPTEIKAKIRIKNLNLSKDHLEITFDDGVYTKLAIQNILKEFSNNNLVTDIKKIKWDASFKEINNFSLITLCKALSGPDNQDSYLIFVIFVTQARFLGPKFYTEKCVN